MTTAPQDAAPQDAAALAPGDQPDAEVELLPSAAEQAEQVRDAATRIGERAEVWFSYLPLIPIALGVVVLAVGLAWLVARWRWPYRRLTPNPFLQDIARRLVQTFIVLLGVLLALEVLDAASLVGGVLGAAGVAGIAIGFAFRDLIENYIASVLLSLRQPFRPRDHVVIETHEGLVTSMNSRTTVLTTFDGNVVRIPNATVFKSPIVNYSTDPRRRFVFEVGVSFDVDAGEAIRAGLEAIKGTAGVLGDPAPFALVKALRDWDVTLQFFGWVDQREHDFGRVRSLAIQGVKAEFERLGVDMPEPTYRLKRVGGGARPEERGAPSKPPVAEGPQRVERDDVVDRIATVNERAADSENLLTRDAPQE